MKEQRIQDLHFSFFFFNFSVLPLPPGNETVVYYISHNGSDTSVCGGSAETACFSLSHVLRLYYTSPAVKGLEIITDKSLIINYKTMVSLNKCV